MEHVTDTVTIVDPTHPLYGHTFPLLTVRVNRSKTHVSVLLPSGRRRSIPRSATSTTPPNHDLALDSPLPALSVRTMLPLARFIQGLKQFQEESHAADIIADSSSTPSRAPDATSPLAPALTDPSASTRSSRRYPDPAHPQRRGKGART